jgi:hypothetical protein
MLIEYGSDVMAKTNDGLTVRDRAHWDLRMMSLLDKAAADRALELQ